MQCAIGGRHHNVYGSGTLGPQQVWFYKIGTHAEVRHLCFRIGYPPGTQPGSRYLPCAYTVQVLTGTYEVLFRGATVEMAMSVVEGKRPRKPKNALRIGLSDPLWDFVRRCWDGRSELRPTVTEVVLQLGRAAAGWNGAMEPHVLIKGIVSETTEPESESREHCKLHILIASWFFLLNNEAGNIFASSGQADLQSPTDSSCSVLFDRLSSPKIWSLQCAMESDSGSVVVEKPLEPSIKPPEEPLETVETRPEPAIESLLTLFTEPQPVTWVRVSQRREESNDDLSVVCPRPDKRYEPRSQLLPEERKPDDVPRKEETDEDPFVAFPHLSKNH